MANRNPRQGVPVWQTLETLEVCEPLVKFASQLGVHTTVPLELTPHLSEHKKGLFLNPGHTVERSLPPLSQGTKLSTAGPVDWADHGFLLVLVLRFLFHPFTHSLFLLPISSP